MPKSMPKTKHFQVARKLREQIKKLEPGDALPTQRQLMKQFKASQATVERAVKRLAVEGLVHRPAGTRRVVVRRHSDPASMRVCVLRPEYPSPLYDAVARAVVIAGQKRDWAFSYVTYRRMSLIDIERISHEHEAVVMLTSSEPISDVLMRVLAKPPVPIVIVQDHREGLTASSVCINDRHMARIATRHLLDLGHPRPVLAIPSLIAGPMKHSVEGWRQAMEAAGIHDLDSLIINAETPSQKDPRYVVYEHWKKLLAKPEFRPSAVYCASGAVALGVLRALREMKLSVPEDVSVVAADAISDIAAFMSPPMTATTVDMSRYGAAVVQLVEEQVSAKIDEPRNIWIDAELTIRESTAPFKAG